MWKQTLVWHSLASTTSVWVWPEWRLQWSAQRRVRRRGWARSWWWRRVLMLTVKLGSWCQRWWILKSPQKVSQTVRLFNNQLIHPSFLVLLSPPVDVLFLGILGLRFLVWMLSFFMARGLGTWREESNAHERDQPPSHIQTDHSGHSVMTTLTGSPPTPPLW